MRALYYTYDKADIFIFVLRDGETETQKGAVVTHAHQLRKGENLETKLEV